MYTKDMKTFIDHAVATNPVKIDEVEIGFEESTEHVGVLRSSAGNLPAILDRFSAHRKALGAVLHAGMARGHRGNPAASLHAESVYGVPVLLSGIASLVLYKSEINMINQHHKDMLSNLQRLLPNTPRTVVYFLGGSLPAEALLHLRQLTLFGMICRLPQCSLFQLAIRTLSSKTPPKSWFSQIVTLFDQYDLDHPLKEMYSPLQKEVYKKQIKKRVVNYWEELLRTEAEDSRYSSLTFFHPRYMSLTSPHPLWTSAGSSPANIAMATTQARMLSGRYKSERLCRHWSKNKNGFCLLSPECSRTVEDIPHILRDCEALRETRDNLVNYTIEYCKSIPNYISELLMTLTDISSPTFCQFLLDCSVVPSVIRAAQIYDSVTVYHHVFTVTRTWIYSLHKRRMKILGRWNLI